MPWTVRDVNRFKKGLSDKQKRQWVSIANSALKTCQAKSGSNCEASAIRQANGVVGNRAMIQTYKMEVDSYQIRIEDFQGTPHIVVPVVLLREGVHIDSRGTALLHIPEEFGKSLKAWNGIPVTINHPEKDGRFISANIPEVFDKEFVGHVFNTKLDNDKLKGEVWIDETVLKAKAPDVLFALQQQKPMDVSVGVFADVQLKEGTWNGEAYTGIERNYTPDHLALLPYDEGACSYSDGCGIRTNTKGGDDSVKHELLKMEKELNQRGYSVIRNNAQGFKEITGGIRSKLEAMDDDVKSYFLEEVFDDYFIYKVVRGTEGLSSHLLFKRFYKTDKNGAIEFTGDPIHAIRNVEYVEAQNLQTNKEGAEMSAEDKVDASTDCADKIVDAIEANIQSKKHKEPEKTEVTKEDAIGVLKETLDDATQAVEVLTGDAKKKLEYGAKVYAEKVETLSKQILEASTAYTAEELRGKSIEDLEKLVTLIKPEANYSGQNFGSGINGVNIQQEAPLFPPQVYAAMRREGGASR